MKKLLALLLALTMVFALAACDLGNTEDPNNDNPDTSQTDDQGNNSQGGNEGTSNTPNTQGGETESLEAPWFGWSEDDIKPDTGFASIEDADPKGWFISLTEPMTADAYKAWYAKIVSKVESLANNGEYTIKGVTDLNAKLDEAIGTFNAGGGAIYLMVEYETGETKIGITTGVMSLESTEDVIYFYIHEVD